MFWLAACAKTLYPNTISESIPETALPATSIHFHVGARCSSMVRAFTHGGPTELFPVPASAPRLV